jgi:hypothetical protein
MIWWILLCLSGTFLTLLLAGVFFKKNNFLQIDTKFNPLIS